MLPVFLCLASAPSVWFPSPSLWRLPCQGSRQVSDPGTAASVAQGASDGVRGPVHCPHSIIPFRTCLHRTCSVSVSFSPPWIGEAPFESQDVRTRAVGRLRSPCCASPELAASEPQRASRSRRPAASPRGPGPGSSAPLLSPSPHFPLPGFVFIWSSSGRILANLMCAFRSSHLEDVARDKVESSHAPYF